MPHDNHVRGRHSSMMIGRRRTWKVAWADLENEESEVKMPEHSDLISPVGGMVSNPKHHVFLLPCVHRQSW